MTEPIESMESKRVEKEETRDETQAVDIVPSTSSSNNTNRETREKKHLEKRRTLSFHRTKYSDALRNISPDTLHHKPGVFPKGAHKLMRYSNRELESFVEMSRETAEGPGEIGLVVCYKHSLGARPKPNELKVSDIVSYRVNPGHRIEGVNEETTPEMAITMGKHTGRLLLLSSAEQLDFDEIKNMTPMDKMPKEFRDSIEELNKALAEPSKSTRVRSNSEPKQLLEHQRTAASLEASYEKRRTQQLLKQDAEKTPISKLQVPEELLSKISELLLPEAETLTGLTQALKRSIVTSISVSILQFFKDLYLLIVDEGTMRKLLHASGILASLINFAIQIHVVCVTTNLAFDLNQAIKEANSLGSEMEFTTQNDNSPVSWDTFQKHIPTIMHGLLRIIAVGLCLVPKDTAFGKMVSNYSNTSKIGEDASKMVNSFLTDIVGLDLEGDRAYIDLLTNLNDSGVKLLVTPAHLFHIDEKLMTELKNWIGLVDQACMRKINPSTHKTLSFTLKTLQTTRSSIVVKLAEMNDKASKTDRQETYGVFLAGDGGIGKSRFAYYLMEQVAQNLGYDNKVYNLDKEKDNFYEPYSAEAFGIANEFGATRGDDPLIKSANKILSKDHYNFESAGLSTKSQPCRLKLAVLTSNALLPDLTKAITKNAEEALYSRFLMVHVTDPEIPNAHDARNQEWPHRKPDFSHLKYRIYKYHEKEPVTVQDGVTVEQLIHRVTGEIAQREKAYLDTLVAKAEKPEEIRDIRQRIDKLGLSQNDASGRVFTCRIEGPPDTGKTYFVEKHLIPELLRVFPDMKVQRFPGMINHTDKSIIVVDDTLENNLMSYFDMIQSTHRDSIVIICTNSVYRPAETWTSATLGCLPVIGEAFYEKPSVKIELPPGHPEGLARRMGFEDFVYVKNGSSKPYKPRQTDCIVLRTLEGYKMLHEHELKSETTLREIVCQKYLDFLRSSRDFHWVNQRLGFDQVEVDIQAPDYDTLIDVMSSPKKLASAFYMTRTNQRAPVQIKISPEFEEKMRGKVGFYEWQLPREPLDLANRLLIAEKISAILARHDFNARIRVNVEDHMYEIRGNIGYYTESVQTDNMYNNLEELIDGIRILSHNLEVKYEQVAQALANQQETCQLDARTIRQIREHYLNHQKPPQLEHQLMLLRRDANLEEALNTAYWKSIFTHPAFIIVGSIVSVCTLATLGYAIWKWCQKSGEEPTQMTKNTSESEYDGSKADNVLKKPTSNYRSKSSYDKIVKSLKSHKLDPKEEAEIDAAWDFTLNAHPDTPLVVFDALATHLKLKEAELNKVKANSLNPEQEIPHSETPLMQVVSKIKENIVRVTGHGTNYGIVLHDNLLITTAHTVYKLEHCFVEDSHTKDACEVVYADKDRDIALVKLTPLFKRYKSLRHILLLGNMPIPENDCWYVRPFNTVTTISGAVDFHPTYKNLNLIVNENFDPKEKIISFYTASMKQSASAFQKGDCGLPLLSRLDGKYYLVGIHNALGNYGLATFASVNEGDLSLKPIQRNEMPKTLSITMQYNDDEFITDIHVKEALDSTLIGKTQHPPEVYPFPIGYCKKMKSHNNTRHSKIDISKGKEFPLANTQHFSCLRDEDMPADVPCPKRRVWNPHTKQMVERKERDPLFLQIMKYPREDNTSIDHKTLLTAIDKVIMYMKNTYVKGTKLRILTEREAINGMGQHLNGFDPTTGVGPILKQVYGVFRKSELYNNVGKGTDIYVLNDTEAARYIHDNSLAKLQGVLEGRPFIIMSKDCRKVELISEEAKKKAKVRLFVDVGFDDNITLKRLLGHLVYLINSVEGGEAYLSVNPYKMANKIAVTFGGTMDLAFGTDVSAMDKNLSSTLLAACCKVFGRLYEWRDGVVAALAQTLTGPLHSFEGDLYKTLGGNLSGWFPTTLLNSVSQMIIVEYWRLTENMNHLQREESKMFTLGDDKIQMMTLEQYQSQKKVYAQFGLDLTVGKNFGADVKEFCSRSFHKDPTTGTWLAELKESAISGMVFKIKRGDMSIAKSNWQLALFESALSRDSKMYDRVLSTILELSRMYQLQSPYLLTRDEYRELYSRYTTGELSGLEHSRSTPAEEIISLCESYTDMDSISALNEHMQKNKNAMYQVDYESTGEPHQPKWKATLSYLNRTTVGSGLSKSESLRTAARAMLETIRDDKVVQNSGDLVEEVKIQYTLQYATSTTNPGCELKIVEAKGDLEHEVVVMKMKRMKDLKRFSKKLLRVGYETLVRLCETYLEKVSAYERIEVWSGRAKHGQFVEQIEELTIQKEDNGEYFCIHPTLGHLKYGEIIGLLEHLGAMGIASEDRIVMYNHSGPNTNPDTPVQPENIQQSTTNAGAATIPVLTNPQPTGMAPTMAPPSVKVMSALEGVIETDNLNIAGPPNMLAVGAIRFDLKDLVYSQFMDCDKQFVITDDTPPGSVLLQIPYDPMGEWVNPYIRQYVQQHRRYTGPLLFRITIVGNPTFSGLIGVAWQPRKVETSTVNVSEMQKFAYYGVTVELPSNKILVLNDARQEKFFRQTTDTTDVDNRPHLVIFTLMSIVSPLREGIQTRIRIASKLPCGGSQEPDVFQVAEPTLLQALSSVNSPIRSGFNGRIGDLIPSIDLKEARLVIDGTFNVHALNNSVMNYTERQWYHPCLLDASSGILHPDLDDGGGLNIMGRSSTRISTEPNKENDTLCYIVSLKTTWPNEVERSYRNVLMKKNYQNTTRAAIEIASAMLDNQTQNIAASSTGNWNHTLVSQFRTQTRDIPLGDIKYNYENEMVYGTQGEATGGFRYLPIAAEVTRAKIVTNLGTGIAEVFAIRMRQVRPIAVFNSTHEDGDGTQRYATTGRTLPIAALVPPTYQRAAWAIDEQLITNGNLEQLPLGWKRLCVTEEDISSVPQVNVMSPTLHSDPALRHALMRESRGLDTNQCLAFDLVDAVSQQRVCSVRFLQETGELVVRAVARYAAYPTVVNNLIITNMGAIQRSNAFPETETTDWLSRVPSVARSFPHIFPKNILANLRIKDKPNGGPNAMMAGAMIGGSVLSGLFQGISQGISSAAQARMYQQYLDKEYSYRQEDLKNQRQMNQDRINARIASTPSNVLLRSNAHSKSVGTDDFNTRTDAQTNTMDFSPDNDFRATIETMNGELRERARRNTKYQQEQGTEMTTFSRNVENNTQKGTELGTLSGGRYTLSPYQPLTNFG